MDARGVLSVATVATLLQDSLLELDEGQSLTLKKSLLFVALTMGSNSVQIEFAEDSVLTRVRTEKKDDFQTFLLSTPDKSQSVVFKKSGYHPFRPGDKLFYVKSSPTSASRAMPRSNLESSLGVAADASRSYGSWSRSA